MTMTAGNERLLNQLGKQTPLWSASMQSFSTVEQLLANKVVRPCRLAHRPSRFPEQFWCVEGCFLTSLISSVGLALLFGSLVWA